MPQRRGEAGGPPAQKGRGEGRKGRGTHAVVVPRLAMNFAVPPRLRTLVASRLGEWLERGAARESLGITGAGPRPGRSS